MLVFRMLCRITQSSDAPRTESVSVTDHEQTMAVSSRVLDQKQQNIFGLWLYVGLDQYLALNALVDSFCRSQKNAGMKEKV